MKFKFLCSYSLIGTQQQLFMLRIVCGHRYATKAKMSSCDRLYGPQSLKYLLSSPLPKKFANP